MLNLRDWKTCHLNYGVKVAISCRKFRKISNLPKYKTWIYTMLHGHLLMSIFSIIRNVTKNGITQL